MEKMKVKLMLTTFLFLLMFLFSQNVFSQIKGKVSDVNGVPIPGVTVLVKGTTTGAITGADGQYSIAIDPKSKILVFSFVGMKSTEVEIGKKTEIDVILEKEEQMIEEVIIVGYGSQRKVSVTGAVSSIPTKELQTTSSASIANALAGRISGLTSIQSGGGQPGRDDATRDEF